MEDTITIILQGSPGVHISDGETRTVQRNGEPCVIPLGVQTPVPPWVVDVLTDSRMLWSKVEEAEPSKAPTPAPSTSKKKSDEDY